MAMKSVTFPPNIARWSRLFDILAGANKRGLRSIANRLRNKTNHIAEGPRTQGAIP